MFKHKILACFFFFIFTLFWSPWTDAMEDDDPMLRFLPPSSSSSVLNAPASPGYSTASLRSVDDNQSLLGKLYERTVTQVRVPDSVRQIGSGVASLFPLFPTGQVFVPTALIGLNSLGLTKYIIPDVGWESWALVAGVGLPIAAAALIATYNGASKFFKPTSDDVIQNQEKCFGRPTSRWESWSQSYPTQIVELVFWSWLFSELLMNTESRVTGWGDYRVIGGIFSAFATVAIYFIIVRAMATPNRYTWRHYRSNEEEALNQACRRPIEETKEHIKTYGLTPETRRLGELLNVIETPLPSDSMLNTINDGTVSLQDNSMSSMPVLNEDKPAELVLTVEPIYTQPSEEQLLNELAKPKYLRVFEKMKDISQSIPPWIKDWNSGSTIIAKYASRVVQFLSIPAQELIAFSVPYVTLNYFGAPAAATIGISAGITAAYTFFLPLISIKQNPLIWKEYEQILRLLKPQEACGYFGERIAPVVGRCGTLLYFTFPVTDFVRNNLLDKVIGITNVPAQIFILAPLMAGIGFAAPSQFLDPTYTTFANWIAKGGPVHLPTPWSDTNCDFKMFWCFDGNGDRANALELVERLEEMENNTSRLDARLTRFHASQIKITLPSGEESSLIHSESDSM